MWFSFKHEDRVKGLCDVGWRRGGSPAAVSGNVISLSFSTHLDIVLFQHDFLFSVKGKI